jgi:hypothetical protein
MGVGMAEIRDADTWIRRFNAVATLLILAAVIGVPYASDRAYRRWSKENDPLAGLRSGLEHKRTRYRESRANWTDMGRVIIDVLVEIDRAGSVGSAR